LVINIILGISFSEGILSIHRKNRYFWLCFQSKTV